MSKIVMIAMSLRKDSYNKKLISNAYRILSENTKHQYELLQFNDFPMPVYDGDLESSSGVPEGAKKLAEKIASAQALVISTPEYNGSIPGAFKNAIDWVSRVKPMPWADKHVLLLGASPGALGAVRSLWHSRVPLEVTGAHVYPEVFGVPHANTAFDEAGRLKDPATEERLKVLLNRYVDHFGK